MNYKTEHNWMVAASVLMLLGSPLVLWQMEGLIKMLFYGLFAMPLIVSVNARVKLGKTTT